MNNDGINDGPLSLRFYHEIRMGWELYSLALDGKVLKNPSYSLDALLGIKKREFRPDYIFSDDKKYLAISEFHSKFFTKSLRYNFTLILFDLHKAREATVTKSVENGYIIPMKFEDKPPYQKIIYHKQGDGFTREFEYKISKLEKWKKF